MRRLSIGLAVLISMMLLPLCVDAQIIKRAGELIQSAIDDTRSDSLSVEEMARRDSIRLHEMELELHELKLNEIVLRSELADALNQSHIADSIKLAEQRQRIDSLRAVTPGVPVVVEGDTLFTIYAARGGYSAVDRAQTIEETLLKIGKDRRIRRDSLYMLDNENYVDVMYGDKVIVTLTEQDALWQSTTPAELAQEYMPLLAATIHHLKEEHSFWQYAKRAGLFVLVLTMQFMLFRLVNFLFRRLRRRLVSFGTNRLKPLVVKDYELLNTRRLCRILGYAANFVRIILLLLLLIFTVPILFAIFPQTENLALRIFSYIIDPIVMVVKSIVEYIPNLFIIIVIWTCVRYIVKGLRYIAGEIQNEKLKISGFYPDWAEPTFNIIRFLLYAFMIAMIYPYLPGSESGVFQGISVFVGLIVSLGSSTVISNFIAGFVITYMRPFKVGDFIKVKDTTGNVIEKTPFVTRLRTIKNEIITIPNSFIMSGDTVNYSASARTYGLIIHTMLTMGYETPWREVHQLLIDSALATPGVLNSPQPFVLETELNDNYMCYQINAYIADADIMPQITSDLLQNIQDNFRDAGIELVAPHYISARDGNASKVPPLMQRRRDTAEE
ncbi:MAG: mechanosensitive ion channel family protein [Bacteroides sp.]|nr:mechanosensitive ion channel family protein [Bacteroides sp.]